MTRANFAARDRTIWPSDVEEFRFAAGAAFFSKAFTVNFPGRELLGTELIGNF